MHTITNGFAKKLLSAFIACALAVTMAPLPSTAYAAEPAQDASASAQTQSSDNADATASEAASEDGAQTPDADASADASAATQGDRVYESVDLTQSATGSSSADASTAASATAAQNGTAATDPEDIEMTRAELSLSGEAAQTVITYAGLSYVLNEDGETVALTGWADKAPAGDVRIPAQVASGGNTYAVTNICTLRGGVFANC